jgi:hypothetical protein
MTLVTRLAPALLLAAAPAFAQDVSLEVVNATALTAMEFYTAPSGTAAFARTSSAPTSSRPERPAP